MESLSVTNPNSTMFLIKAYIFTTFAIARWPFDSSLLLEFSKACHELHRLWKMLRESSGVSCKTGSTNELAVSNLTDSSDYNTSYFGG
jgi:hypothetical protein